MDEIDTAKSTMKAPTVDEEISEFKNSTSARRTCQRLTGERPRVYDVLSTVLRIKLSQRKEQRWNSFLVSVVFLKCGFDAQIEPFIQCLLWLLGAQVKMNQVLRERG